MPRGKNIAYLTSFYPRATDTFVRNEVFRFRERGYTVHTFASRRADSSQMVSELLRRERDNTTYLVSDQLLRAPLFMLKMLLRSPQRFWWALLLARRTRNAGLLGLFSQVAYFVEAAFLADRMLREGIEHLHNHIGEASASVAMLASELSGIPYSLTIHGPYIFRAPERWALGEKIVHSAFTACISHFTKSQCMIYVPRSHWDRLHVIRCGPDPVFLESEPPPPQDSRRLVWVGRICEEKAVPLLVEAAQQLAEQQLDFQLVLLGDGPLRPSIEAQLEAGDLGSHVSITGWMSSEEIREQITSARAVIMPSFAEGLPIVLMEAFALGRPVISTYIAGIPELVEPGVSGWLVPAGSVDQLANAMREALEAPLDRLEQMGRAGRAAVLRWHDPMIGVDKLEELIRASGLAGRP